MSQPEDEPTVFDVEFITKQWINLRRKYAISMRLSINGALQELHKDRQRWRDLSHEACLDRYRSRRVKDMVAQIMGILDALN